MHTTAEKMLQKMQLDVLCLQKHPEFVDQTVELLNNQWPRSKTARLRSIEQGSSDTLPTSLIVIDKQNGPGKEKVLAHSKISPVPSNDQMCFIESVVVDPNIRGIGLGRFIMAKTEEFVSRMGVTTVYLTTHDQQAFYEKLGYMLCEPIIVFGGRSASLNKIIQRNTNESVTTTTPPVPFLQSKTMPNTEAESTVIKSKTTFDNNNIPPLTAADVFPLPPPLPPPSLPIINHQNNFNKNLTKNSIVVLKNSEVKVTMKKVL